MPVSVTPNISIIICTHNPREDYFTRVLGALRAQTFPMEKWELLVVDNCSAVPVEGRVDLSWHPRARVLRENKLGLTHARLRGMREAKGDLLVFVDDDNVLDPDYLTAAEDISASHHNLAAWSGSCRGEFEVQPEPWARRFLTPLCVFEFDRDYWCNYPFQNQSMPSGAGLCLRARAAQHYVRLHDLGLRPMILDRTGNSLLSAGDIDIALTCAQSGYGMGVFTRLQLTHLIPAFRVQKAYLLKLTEALGFCNEIIEFYHPSPAVPSGSKLRTRVASLLRVALMSPIEREFFRANRRGAVAGRRAVVDLRRIAASGPAASTAIQEG